MCVCVYIYVFSASVRTADVSTIKLNEKNATVSRMYRLTLVTEQNGSLISLSKY